jgi:hypothetical protein
MAKAMESLSTINSFLRTLIALFVIGGASAGGWMAYKTYFASEFAAKETEEKLADAERELEESREDLKRKANELALASQQLVKKDSEIASLNLDIQAKVKEIEKLQTKMRLLKVNHRKAMVTVLDAWTDENTGESFSTVEFVELDEQGKPYGKPKVFKLRGDEFHVDCWIVKFDDKYIEEADLLRATSLVLFKSIYGNVDGPTGGYPLEDVGGRPEAYGDGAEVSEFEKKIWDDLWNIANDPVKAEEMVIRAAHGQVNYTKARKGKSYRLDLRASDGLTIQPAEDAPPRTDRPAS